MYYIPSWERSLNPGYPLKVFCWVDEFPAETGFFGGICCFSRSPEHVTRGKNWRISPVRPVFRLGMVTWGPGIGSYLVMLPSPFPGCNRRFSVFWILSQWPWPQEKKRYLANFSETAWRIIPTFPFLCLGSFPWMKRHEAVTWKVSHNPT